MNYWAKALVKSLETGLCLYSRPTTRNILKLRPNWKSLSKVWPADENPKREVTYQAYKNILYFCKLYNRQKSLLRDVTPSHITTLDVTPSEVTTLEVLTYGHYTFGKLHLRAVSPSEYYTFGNYTFRCFTFGTFTKLHLPQILKSFEGENSKGVTARRWNIRKVKSPKV